MPTSHETPRVAALVLNYNGAEITLQSLPSLSVMTYPNYELIVIDNGSTDDSVERIQAAYPDLRMYRKPSNAGPAAGLNFGMERALADGFDFLLILNNDIEVDPEMLTEMMAVVTSDDAVGCVGPKSFYYWNRDRLWAAGGDICFRESVTKERGMGEVDRGQYDTTEDVDYINGCALLTRRDVVEKVGLFDPQFHLACEDADWGMRLKRHGYRSVYAHRAVLYHMVSMSTGVYKPGRTFQTGRSTAIFVRRYAGPWQWLTFAAAMAVALPLAFLRELPKGNQMAAISKLKGVLDGLRVPLAEPPTRVPLNPPPPAHP